MKKQSMVPKIDLVPKKQGLVPYVSSRFSSQSTIFSSLDQGLGLRQQDLVLKKVYLVPGLVF